MRLENRSAIVTGGASGLGLATARKLTELGARVVLVDLPTSAGTERERELGAGTRFVAADVRDEQQVEEAVKTAQEAAPLAVVVNCAGIGNAIRTVNRKGAPFPLEAFKSIVDVNLFGTFNVLRLAAAAMVGQDDDAEDAGLIVNTASAAAFDGQIGQAAYSASKAAVTGMTLPIARDLAQHRIRVVTIAPGLFLTPLFETLDEDQVRALGAQVPHPARLGSPSEFADLVAAIVDNPMLNGETIRLDGALRMGPR